MAPKKNETIFDRAAQAAEDGDAQTCRELAEELRTMIIEGEADEWNAARPAAEQVPTQDGRVAMTRGVGAAFEEAALRGDQKATEKLRARYATLDIRRDRASQLVEKLREREEEARKAEEREAAPKLAKAAAKAVPKALDRLDQAREELRRAEQERSKVVAELRAQLGLAPGSAHLAPEDLWRLHADETGEVHFERRDPHTGHMHHDTKLLRDVETFLAPPDAGALDRVRNWIGRTTSLNLDPREANEGHLQEEINRTRAKLIASKRFDELGDAERLAREAIADRGSPRTRARRLEEADSFLSRQKVGSPR